MPLISKVYNEIPVPISKEIETYIGDKLLILKPDFTIGGQQTSFSCFHFAIPTSVLPPIEIDGKKVLCQKNRIYAINPGEVVICEEQREVSPYTVIFIDKQLIEEACSQISGKSSVIFANKGLISGSSLVSLVNQVINECKTKQIGYEFSLQCLSLLIAVELLRGFESSISGAASIKVSVGEAYMNRSIEYLRENYNIRFSIHDIAHIANLSPYHFIRVFKSLTGKTPFEYLLDIKIEKSLELLKAKKNTITEISLNCGFSSASHFCTAFKKKVGVSPSDFRRMIF